MRSSLPAAAASLALTVVLTGCGGSSDEPDRAAATVTGPSASASSSATPAPSAPATATEPAAADEVLSAAQVKDAILPVELVGKGFTVDKDTSSGKGNLGCLSEVNVKKVKAVHKAKVSFDGGDLGIPFVASAAASLSSRERADETLATFKRELSRCTKVDAKDKKSGRMRLTVTTDEEKSGPGATAQVNLTAVGTLDNQGIQLPFGFRVSLIQVGNNFAYVGFGSVSADVTADAEAIADNALARLLDVVAGRPARPESLGLKVLTEADLLAVAKPTDTDAAA